MNNINDFLVNDISKFKNYVVICEDFYNNPFSVFKNSLETGYDSDWPYGTRTISFNNQHIIPNIVKHLPHSADTSVQFTAIDGGASGSFLKLTKNRYGSWNHIDTCQTDSTLWAAVVYMHPFPILESGTNFNSYKNTSYKHIDSYTDEEKELHTKDNNRWFNNIYSSNVFNKIIIYNGNNFHAPAQPFGHTLFNCRTANTFFLTMI
jgi:hypothetical protein